MKLLGSLMLLTAMAGSAFAGVVAPEIDPASGAAAIAVLTGGLLILRSRRK